MVCRPNSKLTSSLQAYLQSREFRQSKSSYPSEIIDKVLRYAAPLGTLVEQHETLARCMDRLKEKVASAGQEHDPLSSGTVVIAKQLMNGCGRFDREWYAPEGGFWMAVAWADTLLPEFSSLLPLAAGIASCEAIRSFGVDAKIKWVNDVHVNGRKIGGVLCETITGDNPEDRYHLIGIGINCNNASFPQELDKSATSILNELHRPVDLEQFSVVLLAHLAWNFGLIHLHEEQAMAWERDGRQGDLLNPVVEVWKELSDSPGRLVVYGYDVVREPMYRATVLGIDKSGGLVMKLESGEIVTENSGEIIYLAG